jgi:perilipin-2
MSAESNGKSKSKPTENGNGTVAVFKPDASLLPHLESWERMMKLPVVEAAWTQSQGVYDKVRGK